MRVGSLQRQRKSSILPVIGGCLAVYAVCAVGFHALVEPSLGKNQPPPPPIPQYSAAALAARAEVTPSPVAANRPASTAAAAPAARAAAPKVTAKVAPAAGPDASSGSGSGPGSGGRPQPRPWQRPRRRQRPPQWLWRPRALSNGGIGTRSGVDSDRDSNAGSDSGHRGKDRRGRTEEAGPQARGSAQAAAKLL